MPGKKAPARQLPLEQILNLAKEAYPDFQERIREQQIRNINRNITLADLIRHEAWSIVKGMTIGELIEAMQGAPGTKAAKTRKGALQDYSGAILTHLRRVPNSSAEQLSKALGITEKRDKLKLGRQLTAMVEAGQLKKEGEKRGTKYSQG